jgi:hypothetical protein
MATLIYSDKCQYSAQAIKSIQENPALLHIVRFHNVSTHGVPSKQITRVPTLMTNDGKLLVGQEVMNWLQSMVPVTVIEGTERGIATSMLDGSDDPTGDMFSLDNYGASLAPPMTPDLEKRINQKVQDAYASVQTAK